MHRLRTIAAVCTVCCECVASGTVRPCLWLHSQCRAKGIEMKMSDDTRAKLAEAIKPLDTDARRAQYRARDFPRAELVKDLDKRYRWDLLYAAGVAAKGILSGLDDSHIDTALRALVPSL